MTSAPPQRPKKELFILPIQEYAALLKTASFNHKQVRVPTQPGGSGGGAGSGAAGSEGKMEDCVFIDFPDHRDKDVCFSVGSLENREGYSRPFLGTEIKKFDAKASDDTMAALVIVPDSAESKAMEDINNTVREKVQQLNDTKGFIQSRTGTTITDLSTYESWRDVFGTPDKTGKKPKQVNFNISVKLPVGDVFGDERVVIHQLKQIPGQSPLLSPPMAFNIADWQRRGQHLVCLCVLRPIKKSPAGWGCMVRARIMIQDLPPAVKPMTSLTIGGVKATLTSHDDEFKSAGEDGAAAGADSGVEELTAADNDYCADEDTAAAFLEGSHGSHASAHVTAHAAPTASTAKIHVPSLDDLEQSDTTGAAAGSEVPTGGPAAAIRAMAAAAAARSAQANHENEEPSNKKARVGDS
jgi:hypothetical protein